MNFLLLLCHRVHSIEDINLKIVFTEKAGAKFKTVQMNFMAVISLSDTHNKKGNLCFGIKKNYKTYESFCFLEGGGELNDV